MEKSVEDRATEWQTLILEWESALNAYEATLRTRPTAGVETTKAEHRLIELKRRINALLGESKRARVKYEGHLVLGTVVLHDRETRTGPSFNTLDSRRAVKPGAWPALASETDVSV